MKRRPMNEIGRKPWKRGDRVLAYVRISMVGDRGEDLISDKV